LFLERSSVCSAADLYSILNKTGVQKMEDMTKEISISGNYLVGIRLELLISEEYDSVCCEIVSNSNSNYGRRHKRLWKII